MRAARVFFLLLVVGLAPGLAPAEEADPAKALPTVVVLATGGTIAGSAPSPTDAAYDPSKLSVDVLLEAVPELSEIAKVRGEQISQIASQDMTDAVWLKLARRVQSLLAEKDVAGVVITHGTDTMEETAYFLNLVVTSDKPVVLTGAMRASTSLSADGPLNLYNAVGIAADPAARNRGVMILFDDRILAARGATKGNTVETGSFRPRSGGRLGTAQYGKNRFFRRVERVGGRDAWFDLGGLKALPRVDIVYAHEGMDGALIDAAVEAGAKGIVTAGVGNGNLNAAALAAMDRAVKKGVVVVRSSRVGSGEVGRNLEIDDDARGFVVADDLSPQQARILLRLTLLDTSDVKRVQKYFRLY